MQPNSNSRIPMLPRWDENPVPEHEVRQVVREILRQSTYEVMGLFQKVKLPEPLDGHRYEDECEKREIEEIDALWGDRLNLEYRPSREEVLKLKTLLEESHE